MSKLIDHWKKFFEAKSKSEKEAIIKEVYPEYSSDDLEMYVKELLEDEEKGFFDLLLKAHVTDDPVKKEAIWASIELQELRNVLAEREEGD